jgi:lactate dehydrogenase-like 2-hydroxyacid dehydrogenase
VFARLNVRRVPLEDLLRESDVVSLHCALTTQTRGMLNAESLSLMQPTALLVNTARGAVVEWEALLSALESGRPGAAALDVFAQEPLVVDERVAALGDKLLLSPHMVAANAGGTLLSAVPWGTESALDAIRGIWPPRVVNPEARSVWVRRFEGENLLPGAAGKSAGGVR